MFANCINFVINYSSHVINENRRCPSADARCRRYPMLSLNKRIRIVLQVTASDSELHQKLNPYTCRDSGRSEKKIQAITHKPAAYTLSLIHSLWGYAQSLLIWIILLYCRFVDNIFQCILTDPANSMQQLCEFITAHTDSSCNSPDRSSSLSDARTRVLVVDRLNQISLQQFFDLLVSRIPRDLKNGVESEPLIVLPTDLSSG